VTDAVPPSAHPGADYPCRMSDLLRVEPGFRLSDIDPRSTPGFDGGKKDGVRELARGADELADLQERLFAGSLSGEGDGRSILLVLQAMDTAGKGGIVGHVVGQVNPQGVRAFAFKAPTEEEKSHDFLWRVRRRLPPAGYFGVFDRSHYEDVLIHRVHGFSTLEQIEQRYGVINDFESSLVGAGTALVKVMLHISPEEQKKRLTERLERPEKNWKYNPGDVDERLRWSAYQEAYQIALDRTSTTDAPWSVVPADHKWYARLAVQRLLLDALRGMHLEWPRGEYDVAAEKARLALA
jgi:PPK2 family polyphosphate:nucleotide phosphotransferase